MWQRTLFARLASVQAPEPQTSVSTSLDPSNAPRATPSSTPSLASPKQPVLHHPRCPALPSKQFTLTCSVYFRSVLVLLATSSSSQAALSGDASGPRPPVSIRVRHRLDCTSLRTGMKRLVRSGVSSTSLHAMAPTPNHVGCHHVKPARHSVHSARKAGPNFPP